MGTECTAEAGARNLRSRYSAQRAMEWHRENAPHDGKRLPVVSVCEIPKVLMGSEPKPDGRAVHHPIHRLVKGSRAERDKSDDGNFEGFLRDAGDEKSGFINGQPRILCQGDMWHQP
jgi:hypothetical protein